MVPALGQRCPNSTSSGSNTRNLIFIGHRRCFIIIITISSGDSTDGLTEPGTTSAGNCLLQIFSKNPDTPKLGVLQMPPQGPLPATRAGLRHLSVASRPFPALVRTMRDKNEACGVLGLGHRTRSSTHSPSPAGIPSWPLCHPLSSGFGLPRGRHSPSPFPFPQARSRHPRTAVAMATALPGNAVT